MKSGLKERQRDISPIFPTPNLSKHGRLSKKYAYLLKDSIITRPDQVWATDITYIRLNTGFVYLVAIIDWYSRYVLSWELSNTLDDYFCLSALERALSSSRPLIFNSDQGAQFTSDAFTNRLTYASVGLVPAACLTTFSLSVSGGPSSMNMSIYTLMTRFTRLGVA